MTDEPHPYIVARRSWPLSAAEVEHLPDPPAADTKPVAEHGAVIWQEDAAEALRALLELVCDPVKYCAYCGLPHVRRGRCCCPEHGRKMSSALSAHRAWCRRRLDKIATKRHDERVRERAWGALAMGRDPDAQLARLFDLAGLK